MKYLWHRLLCFLRIRDDFDYAPPFAPEVKHPYEKDARLKCCTHCGGGSKHAIHREPYDERRMLEILRTNGGLVQRAHERETSA